MIAIFTASKSEFALRRYHRVDGDCGCCQLTTDFISAFQFSAFQLGCDVGYSDHTLGIEAAILAVACGAKVIEKHFTLDKHHSDFRDHQLSADPQEMKQLVSRVREAVTLLGNGKKTVQSSEQPIAAAVQRRIVAATDIECDTIIEFKHLNWVRRPDGLTAGQEHEVLGRSTKVHVLEGPDDLNPSH
jgi:sialic acid synthase SpsE